MIEPEFEEVDEGEQQELKKELFNDIEEILKDCLKNMKLLGEKIEVLRNAN